MSAIAITVAALLADDGVTAIVGERVHAVTGPQGTELPNVVLTLAGEADSYVLSGRSRFPEATVIVDCRASTYAQADVLADRVVDALADLVNVELDGVTATIMRGTLSVTDRGDDGRIFRRRQSFSVHWR